MNASVYLEPRAMPRRASETQRQEEEIRWQKDALLARMLADQRSLQHQID
jgi:hypothetical protein